MGEIQEIQFKQIESEDPEITLEYASIPSAVYQKRESDTLLEDLINPQILQQLHELEGERNFFGFSTQELQETINNPKYFHVMIYIARDKDGRIVGTTTAKLHHPNELLEEPSPIIEITNTGVRGNTDMYKILEVLFSHLAQSCPDEIIAELQTQHSSDRVASIIDQIKKHPILYFYEDDLKDPLYYLFNYAKRALKAYNWSLNFTDGREFPFTNAGNLEGESGKNYQTEIHIKFADGIMTSAKFYRLYSRDFEEFLFCRTDCYKLPQELLDALKDPNSIISKSHAKTKASIETVPEEQWQTIQWGRNYMRITVRDTGIYYKILTPENVVLEYTHLAGGQIAGFYQSEGIGEIAQQLNATAFKTLLTRFQNGVIAGKDN